eukprot:444833-Rhodomonas_salina.1
MPTSYDKEQTVKAGGGNLATKPRGVYGPLSASGMPAPRLHGQTLQHQTELHEQASHAVGDRDPSDQAPHHERTSADSSLTFGGRLRMSLRHGLDLLPAVSTSTSGNGWRSVPLRFRGMCPEQGALAVRVNGCCGGLMDQYELRRGSGDARTLTLERKTLCGRTDKRFDENEEQPGMLCDSFRRIMPLAHRTSGHCILGIRRAVGRARIPEK